MEQGVDTERLPPAAPEKNKTLTMVIYALQALGFLVGVSWIVAVVMNYYVRQIRTFWFGLLWGVIGSILLLILVGWLVLMADAIWIIYRIVKGWLYLNDNKPLPI